MEGSAWVYDDNGHECTAITQIHNPFASEDSQDTKNKSIGTWIVFNETFLFLRNFPILYEKNDLPIYLVLKVLEKPKPLEILDQKKVAYRDAKKDNFGDLEYQVVSWLNFEIS